MSEIDLKVVQNTQKSLGKYIKKPPLTEKLLKKPPFRFIHDVTTSVIRETGFLKGLYAERELVSENVKDKEDKISFLNKLIDATKTITGKDLAVRPTKVIAGLEPTETNLLLQAIGYALENQLDSSQFVTQVSRTDRKSKSESNVKDKTVKSKTKEKLLKPESKDRKIPLNSNSKSQGDIKSVASKTSVSKTKTSTRKNITNAGGDYKSKEKVKTPKEKNQTPREEVKKPLQEKPKDLQENGPVYKEEIHEINEEAIEIEEKSTSQAKNLKPVEHEAATFKENTPNENNETFANLHMQRIKSARPKSGVLKIKEEVLNEESSNKSSNESLKVTPDIKEENVIGASDSTTSIVSAEINGFTKSLARPRSSLRPPSVRPSSARPGAPRLRNENFIPEGEVIPLGKVNVIVENFESKDLDEEDTVIIQAVPEPEFQVSNVLPMPTDKGHLVEQILEQINQDDVEHTKHNINIEWEQDGLRARNATTKEIEQLKSAIQTLTKTANPLGKLINYLHEDYEAMHSELEMWTNLAKQTMVDVANQKRLSYESNKPLQVQLEEIEENIIKHQQQINSIYGNISRNETRIRDLIIK